MRVVPALIDIEAGSAEDRAAFEGERGERRDVARRPEPEHTGCPSRRKAAKPVQTDLEWRRSIGDGSHEVERRRGPCSVDLSEEVHGQMERLRTRPANVRDPLTESLLQPLRRSQSRFSEGNGEEAPHPAGLAVAVAFGLGLAGDGLGVGDVHGLPPAFVNDTSISFAAQS